MGDGKPIKELQEPTQGILNYMQEYASTGVRLELRLSYGT